MSFTLQRESIMKRIVLTFGLISGAILSAMMFATMPFLDRIGFDKGEILGYTTMVAAFLLVFFGVRSYRDNVAGGAIRFGRAMAVGSSIAAIATLCYVASWQVLYRNFIPDFATKYQAYLIEKARQDGESEEAIARKQAEMARMMEWYKNPLVNVAITFLEPLPVALPVTLLSAGILSRRRSSSSGQVGTASRSAVSI
jgi:hypothetical protein